jgi:tetratricopeptide (TPR) repeat protein
MKKYLAFIVLFVISLAASGQTPQPTPAQPPSKELLDVATYGVRLETDQRLIVMMAALDAAGFDPTPAGRAPAQFRVRLRKDLQDLEADLRVRLSKFFADHNRELDAEFAKTKPPQSERAARYAERYISLAYALGPPPVFEMPARSDDLPGGVLEVLDFTPLLREFYRKARLDERMPEYQREYRAAGDGMRPALVELVRGVLSYLHTQPVTISIERKEVKAPGSNKKNAPKKMVTREYERRFFVVPDLLAVPGAINLRVIADDYYVIVPPGLTPASSEMRRAYLQYVADPLAVRFNKDISARRDDIKKLLDERRATGRSITPDIFLTVSRSLIVAAEVRMNEIYRANRVVQQINAETDAAKRGALLKQLRDVQATLSDDSVLQLAEAYESGAVLSFFFAEQLKGQEAAGFDVAAMIPDMLATFDATRESKRLAENDPARQRAAQARAERLKAAQTATPEVLTGRALMLKRLSEIETLFQQKSYVEAEAQLKDLLTDFPGEPRIFFALGRAASGSAQDATDEEVQAQRLNTALGQFRLAVEKASPDTDKPLLSRAHYLMGRIYEHFEQKEAALKEYEAAIQLGPVKDGAFAEAQQGKARLSQS